MVKKKRKPVLSQTLQNQIRTEYSLGARVSELVIKYDRSKSIISRMLKNVSRDDEKLAIQLANINQEIGTRKEHEQHLIIQRSKQIQKIKDGTIKGTNYIVGRTLNKLIKLDDDNINFNDLSQAQGVMSKAHAIVEPRANHQVNVNTQINNAQMSRAEVKAELEAEGIPDDLLEHLND